MEFSRALDRFPVLRKRFPDTSLEISCIIPKICEFGEETCSRLIRNTATCIVMLE